jgi:hypothetical protein
MAESRKRLGEFRANPNKETIQRLREVQARFVVEIRIIDREISKLEDDSDDSMF